MASLSPILKRILAGRPRPLVWPPLKIAHRGACGDAPENTLASFELAWRQGVNGIEFDVHLSSDGVPVVIHDARLNRTTSGHGLVAEHRARVLRRLDAGSWFNHRFPSRARERFAGVRIPTLGEILRWARARGCLAFIEIKDPAPGAEAIILREIDNAEVWHLARVISFDLRALARLRHLSSEVRLGVDLTRRLLTIGHARALGAEALLPHWVIASRGFIRRAHRASLLVIPWTINHPFHMRQKILDGVDGIITKYPARLTAAVEQVERLKSKS